MGHESQKGAAWALARLRRLWHCVPRDRGPWHLRAFVQIVAVFCCLWIDSVAHSSNSMFRCVDAQGVNHLVDHRLAGAECTIVLAPSAGAPEGAPNWSTALVGAGIDGFLAPPGNVFEYASTEVLQRFYARWVDRSAPRVAIAHFGDSLLQSGYAAQAMRLRLQAARGDGGRGMVFPYAMAKTYSQNDFKSTFEGDWVTANSMQLTPKLDLGISGFVARTTDPSTSFTFEFNPLLSPGPKKIRVFFKSAASSFKVTLTSGAISRSIDVQLANAGFLPVVDFEFAELGGIVRFDLESPAIYPGFIEIHGVSIENTASGLVHHNLGVGGATYKSILLQGLYAEQITYLKPDLVILDWGTNDLIYKNEIPEDLAETVIATIRKVRAASPGASILLTSVQDMNFKGRNISIAQAFSGLIRKIAFENGCLFYDWYRVSGGPGSMRDWHANGLASNDNVHLTAKGYRLKGELFAQALLQSLDQLGRGSADAGRVTAPAAALFAAAYRAPAPALQTGKVPVTVSAAGGRRGPQRQVARARGARSAPGALVSTQMKPRRGAHLKSASAPAVRRASR